MLCYPTDGDDAPADTRLHRDYFGMHWFEWQGSDGTVEDIEFRLGHGDMIRLLRSSGFEIEDLVEVQAPPGGTAHPYIPLDGHGGGPAPRFGRCGKCDRAQPFSSEFEGGPRLLSELEDVPGD